MTEHDLQVKMCLKHVESLYASIMDYSSREGFPMCFEIHGMSVCIWDGMDRKAFREGCYEVKIKDIEDTYWSRVRRFYFSRYDGKCLYEVFNKLDY